ncbi:MAG: hypothetical protein HXY50_07130 [Ignavibacteriaceae bacterium]|nr:hypothetical protein [Ignavibacteriaceae bacterium]
MGIDFANTPSLNDYINQTFPVGDNPLNDFNSAINFSGEFGYFASKEFHLGAELGYLLNSYNFSSDLGKYEISYNVISPSFLGYYVITGGGYNLKVGGGFGIRFANVDLSFPGTNFVNNYSSTGYGFILRTEGNTLLGNNFFASIGADLKYDAIGEPKSENEKINQQFDGVNLNSLAVSLRLGISYFF